VCLLLTLQALSHPAMWVSRVLQESCGPAMASDGETASNVIVSTLFGMLFVLTALLVRRERIGSNATHAHVVRVVYLRLLLVVSFCRTLW
jgi:hypothetical protein